MDAVPFIVAAVLLIWVALIVDLVVDDVCWHEGFRELNGPARYLVAAFAIVRGASPKYWDSYHRHSN